VKTMINLTANERS